MSYVFLSFKVSNDAAGVLHILALYNLLDPGTSFYRKSKINIKRKPNYDQGWFHN